MSTMQSTFGILKRVNLSLMVLALALQLLAACGKKNAPQPPLGETYTHPQEYPRR